MTDKATDTNAHEHANTPLALKLTEGLGAGAEARCGWMRLQW